MQTDTVAIIVGAGPAGLATAASLTVQSIPYILLEREDNHAPLWTKYSYDRLHLHLPKQVCELPHRPFPPSFPAFVPRPQFLEYLSDYVSHFNIRPLYRRNVELAYYDEVAKKWVVEARNSGSGEVERYSSRFLVVASGETCDPFVPEVEGLDSFPGEVFHSTRYKNGKPYTDKSVLVVGSGNSGMEIALDLANHGAKTSIVLRSPMHILPRWLMYAFTFNRLFRYFSRDTVDKVFVMLSKLVFGDLSKYGIRRPEKGPLYNKDTYGTYPVIDLGTCSKIKSGAIQVLPGVASIRGNEVVFQNGKSHPFDTIVFCTGFKRSTSKWLKEYDWLLNDKGFSKQKFPNAWKGENGLYCNGLSGLGFGGMKMDSPAIANHIKSLLPNVQE